MYLSTLGVVPQSISLVCPLDHPTILAGTEPNMLLLLHGSLYYILSRLDTIG